MEELERLRKSWLDSGRFLGIHKRPSLEKRGLVFGAQTLLAKRNRDGALDIDGEEAKLLTLLAVAYGRPVDLSVLNSFSAASKHTRAGDECMAAMSVALARLPQLLDPDDAARRLFIAEGLVAAGVRPQDIWKALEFELSDELEKLYNQNEARNPKGDGDISGRWASGSGNSSGVEEPLSTDARAVEAERAAANAATTGASAAEAEASEVGAKNAAEAAARRLAFWKAAQKLVGLATYGVPGLDVAEALWNMMGDAMPSPTKGKIPGRPDLRYVWDEDQNQLSIFQNGDPFPVLQTKPSAGGVVRDQRGRKIARLFGKGIQFDPEIMADAWTSPEDKRRRLLGCPIERPDRPGSGNNPLNVGYEDFIKKQNNDPPTKSGYGYYLTNPFDGRPVVVDDCIKSQNKLDEIKRGYSDILKTPKGRIWMAVDWGYQATRQYEFSDGRKMEWDFSDKPAADWAHTVFSWVPWLHGVDVEWKPWVGHK